MAANKFATILRRNTDGMIFLLIYTALEWILIILLLLNALFSYTISKFASFFGLKPTCIFCSRIDHLFERGRSRSSCRDFLCESHAREVSKLGFCSNHCRLADAGDMCEDCAASKPGEADRSVALLSWMKRSEQGEKDLRCSCCGVALESGFYSPYLLLKTKSWDVLEFAPMEKSKKGECFGFEETEQGKEKKPEEEEEEEKGDSFLPSPGVEKMINLDRILPIELIDSSTMVKSPVLEILTVAEEEIMAAPSSKMQEIEQHSFVLVPTSEPCDVFSTDAKKVEALEFERHQASEEDGKGTEEATCETSIGSEIFDQEQIERTQFHETEPSELIEQSSRRAKHLKICPVLDDIEEETLMPETPTTPNYMDNSFAVLHKRLLLEKRESGTESLDGSITGDMDSLEPPTIDRLKTALKSERKALIALFSELEEERSASAIAANQTMAMITRLQEEKAAMQMEALQYQRMMEEQSEYDQEALQLLNELMTKREKEKQELKKELEAYRHKVRVYEAIERRKMEEFVDVNQNSMEDDDDDDDVKNLIAMDESLAEFEEERVSILEQLKALEEKLFTMDDERDCFDCKHLKQSPIENGDFEYGALNGCGMGGKRLLPHFYAVSLENVYERLQALEAEREFVKHCLASLKKGERGLDLLQEILHHLRDLRIVELRSRHIEA